MPPHPPLEPGTILRAASTSSPQSLAGAIAFSLYDRREARVRCIGAGATNQAVKAIAIARGFVATRGFDLVVRPGFLTVESHGGEVSSIIFNITI